MPPVQKPHSSGQTVYTPTEFLDAVQARFGRIILDAASDRGNVCSVWFGPGGVAPDGLATQWPRGGLVWCNPPFRDARKWARKCAEELRERDVYSVMLVPLALETRWFEAIEHHCVAHVLRPRLRFVGHAHDYPKGLMLLGFNPSRVESSGIIPWRWKW